MKQRLKGLLALVLSLVMVFALATNAWATVSIGGVEMGDGTTTTYYYNGTNGAQGSTSYTDTGNWNAKVERINGVQTLTLNNFSASGIYAYGDLTISLNGANNIIENTSGDGIYFSDGTLTIIGTGTVNISGTAEGISATSGGANVVISGGTVTASGTNNGILASNITISGGTVTAIGSNGDGIYANKVTISGGTVTATGSNDYGYGIYALESNSNGGDITISNGTVTATGGRAGMYADNKAAIEGGTVTATGGSAGAGIGADNAITISGADTNVTVGCETGLKASTMNILENSTVTITTNATAPAVGKAIDATTLNFGGNWYQWSENGGPVNISSNTNQLTVDAAKGIQTLTIGKIVQVSTYTVKFNANGGSGTMADATGISGNYTLPANGFTAPVGDDFFGWSVDPAGAERKLPGDTMQITRDTTVYAIWKYATLGNQGGGYPGTPQPPSIYIPTVEDEPEVTTPNTFDGGIASAVVVTILSATGGAWLAKKKD